MVFVLPEIPPAETKLRSHPWARNADESGGYSDFVAHPELIPQVLEDYRPFDAQPAVHLFYDMLRWINGPESLLETNDCALAAPVDNDSPIFAFKRRIGGRLELFYREHAFNTTVAHSRAFEPLQRYMMLYMQAADRDFCRGSIIVGTRPTLYERVPNRMGLGLRLSLCFDAFGDTDDEAFESLGRLFDAVWQASRRVTRAMQQDYRPLSERLI